MSDPQANVAPPGVFTPIPGYLFTANVDLGTALGPIPVLGGGQHVIEPITGGTIQGPAFNATIEGGFAAPLLVSTDNGTQVKMAFVWAYGHASDGSPFYLEESGIGIGKTQTTRINVRVGGQYEGLQSIYILAQPTISSDHTKASVECFSVPLP